MSVPPSNEMSVPPIPDPTSVPSEVWLTPAPGDMLFTPSPDQLLFREQIINFKSYAKEFTVKVVLNSTTPEGLFIRGGAGSGTAFSIAGAADREITFFLTNRHVIEKADQNTPGNVEWTTLDGAVLVAPFQVVKRSYNEDIAIIMARIPTLALPDMSRWSIMSPPADGTEVFGFGYPKGLPTFLMGRIFESGLRPPYPDCENYQFKPHYLASVLDAYGGSSGSALFTLAGRLIGMTYAMIPGTYTYFEHPAVGPILGIDTLIVPQTDIFKFLIANGITKSSISDAEFTNDMNVSQLNLYIPYRPTPDIDMELL